MRSWQHKISTLEHWRPWQRLTCFLVVAILSVIGYLALFGVLSHGKDLQTAPAASIAPLLLAGVLLILNLIFLRAEGWSQGAIGLDQPWRRICQFFTGFGFGCALVMVWAILLTICMGIQWHWARSFHLAGALPLLSFTLFLAASEELAYRGYLLLRMSRSHSALASAFITSLLFTVMHLQGGVPWLNAMAGIFTCALVYSALVLRWSSVPLAIGFHAANNVMQNLLGLRESPMTILQPAGGHSAGGMLALALVSVLNIGVFVVLWRGTHPHTGSAWTRKAIDSRVSKELVN